MVLHYLMKGTFLLRIGCKKFGWKFYLCQVRRITSFYLYHRGGNAFYSWDTIADQEHLIYSCGDEVDNYYLLGFFSSCTFSLVKRNDNIVAHSLAPVVYFDDVVKFGLQSHLNVLLISFKLQYSPFSKNKFSIVYILFLYYYIIFILSIKENILHWIYLY